VTGCKDKEINDDGEISKEEKFMIGNTLDDGRIIHFTFDVPYGESGLSYALSNNEISLNDFISRLDIIDALNDGGSTFYKYNKRNMIFGDEDFYVLVCNSFDNINDIYVAKNRESLDSKCSILINDLDGVSMSIKEGTLTRSGATIIITDISNRNNIYGEEYRIDKLENGNWQELDIVVDGNYGFNSIGYSVGEDNKLELDINWEWLYGKLDNGEYRLVKDTSKAFEGSNHYITVEFVIK